jgi:hypothetical protein
MTYLTYPVKYDTKLAISCEKRKFLAEGKSYSKQSSIFQARHKQILCKCSFMFTLMLS